MDNVIELIKEITKKSIVFSVENDQLAVHGPKDELNASDLDALAAHQAVICRYSHTFPLSVQSAKLLATESNAVPESFSCVVEIESAIALKRIQDVWGLIVQHHPLLRASVSADTKNPHFTVVEEAEALTVIAAEEGAVDSFLAMPWQIHQESLCRALLVKGDKQSKHQLMISVHSLIADGISETDVANTFKQVLAGELKLAGESLAYIQYVATSAGQDVSASAAYYTQTLSRETHRLALFPASGKPSPATETLATHSIALTKKQVTTFNRYCKQQSCSLPALTAAAMSLVLSRYSEQSLFLLGMAGENFSVAQSLPLTSSIDAAMPISDLLSQLTKQYEAVTVSGHYSLGLVETLHAEPIYDVVIHADSAPGISPIFTSDVTELAVSLHVATNSGLTLYFPQSRYSADQVAQLANNLIDTLQAIVAAKADVQSQAINVVGDVSRQLLLETFNGTQATVETARCLHELVVEQALQTPDAIAVLHEAEGEQHTISYAQLLKRSETIALFLQNQGVQPDQFVGVCMPRCIDMIVSMLGILRAGCAYVPLDPDYPDDRLRFILEDSQAAIVLSHASVEAKLVAITGEDTQAVMVDTQWQTIEQVGYTKKGVRRKGIELAKTASPNHLAYAIYTSGSTGKPKGVAIEHKSPVALVNWAQNVYSRDELAGVLASTSICFDLSVFEIFLTLSTGGKLIVVPNALGFADIQAKDQVTLINTVPSAIDALLNDDAVPNTVRIINLAGEPLIPELVDRMYAQTQVERVYDLYGPSEDTTYSTFMHRLPNAGASIGRPVANTDAYILDENLQLAPIGVPGELHLSGDGLARGYLNRDDLTQKSFIANPYKAGTRMYKTGDLVRWLPNGTLEYLGRIDNQVKIRGFRIEIGEVETRLREYSGIHEAVVVAQGEGANKHLVAFFVKDAQANADFSNEAMNNQLRQSLPDYMVPAGYCELEAIPLTQNGKTDRKALTSMQVSFQVDSDYVAPRNTHESQLVDLWAELLAVDSATIGIHDNFFELGGHSLLATQLVSRLRNLFSIQVSLADLFDIHTVAELAEFVTQADSAQVTKIVAVNAARDSLPLSAYQARLWAIQQLDKSSSAYNLPIAYSIEANVSVAHLEAAINGVLARHEVLRTCFPSQQGKPYLKVQKQQEIHVEQLDLSSHQGEESQKSALLEYCQADARKPFDLSQDVLVRMTLISLSDSAHVLYVNMHHIINDGWSQNILIQEMQSAIDALVAGKTPQLPALAVQYADFAVWHNQWLQSNGLIEQQLGYWKDKLSGMSEILELMPDFPRPTEQQFAGDSQFFTMDAELVAELKRFAEQRDCTLYMVLMAAFKTLLFRYTAQEDISVGAPISNRQQREAESLIGMFVNTLVIRDHMVSEDSFDDLLARVKQTCLDAYSHQDVPFEKVVDAVASHRDTSATPLFQHMLVLQNDPVDAASQLFTPYPLPRFSSMFDITIELTETEDGIAGLLEYATSLFTAETMQRFAEHFTSICRLAVSQPQQEIGLLDYMSEQEKQEVIATYSGEIVDYKEDETLYESFEITAANYPDYPAITFEGETITYAEMNARANQLAHFLREKGVGPEICVGLSIHRSFELVIAIHAVMKAGGAYVPLDPDVPTERFNHIMNDCGAKIVLTQPGIRPSLPTDSVDIYDVHDPKAFSQYSTDNISRHSIGLTVDSLAYVIYTSGSTGTPKGVQCAHRGIMNRIRWAQENYPITSDAVIMQKTPYLFDVSIWEFMWPFTVGARLVVAKPDGHKEPHYLVDLIREQSVNILHFVPSMLSAMLASGVWKNLPTVRRVLCSGEALPMSLQDDFFRSDVDATLHNLYGPTEAAIEVTHWQCDPESNTSFVPIGYPLQNISLLVLDKHCQLVPKGVPGELHLCGLCLARGYANRDELNAKTFIQNPHWDGKDKFKARLYKTGDRARGLDNGLIDYMGRIDNQVKLRGFRIELGEIEARLMLRDDIKDIVVLLKGEGVNKQLIGYYVNTQTTPDKNIEIPASELRAYLLEGLPEYMVPSAFVSLGDMPLTPTGKANRRAVAEVEVKISNQREHVSPTNTLQKQLTQIWADAMGITSSDVSLDDNYFDIGGNSINAITVVAKIEEQFKHPCLPVMLFKYSTVRSLAAYLATKTEGTEALTEQVIATSQPESTDPQQHTLPVTTTQDETHTTTRDEWANAPLVERPDYYNDSIAIIGISCQMPEAQDHWAFWNNLIEGRESIYHQTKEELNAFNLSSDMVERDDLVPVLSGLEGKDLFDPEFFKLSSGNASMMDPQFRHLLMHAWRVVEDAGYQPKDVENTGVYISTSNNFYTSIATQVTPHPEIAEDSEEFMLWLMAQGGTVPTMISYQLGFKGPSLFSHTNCSSSLVSLHTAIRSLQAGDIQQALVGASTLSADFKVGYVYHSGMNLSSDGHVKTFDERADGLVEGEGVVMIMLKRASDAISDNDNIYSLIRGISINNDGREKAGFYAPSVIGQTEVIQQALAKANVNPETISYVEAHGTGTALGDPIEVLALSEAYQAHTQNKQYCAIGSVKPNIGHLDTAAGLAGCIKVAMSLYNKQLPALINYNKPNPQIDFESTPFYVAEQSEKWTPDTYPKRMAISAFGIGGTNAHAIFEEYWHSPYQSAAHGVESTNYIIPLSAQKPHVLKDYAQSLLRFLQLHTTHSNHLRDIAYTYQVGRTEMDYRAAFIVSDLNELQSALENFINEQTANNIVLGNIHDNRASVLLDGDDELISRWIEKNKLNKLAQIWVSGHSLDWACLYQGAKPRRVSLPTYPFDKSSYRLQAQHHSNGVRETETHSVIHPLVQLNTSNLEQQAYRSVLTGKEFFLTDHKIQGKKLLPGVAYLEMARTAIEQAVPNLPEGSVIELRNAVWAKPIIVDTPVMVEIELVVIEDDKLEYQVLSEDQLHYQGSAVLIEETPEQYIDVSQLQSRMQLATVNAEQLYAAFVAMGTGFGPAFQGVKDIQWGEQELLVNLVLPESVKDTYPQYQLHPSLMDASLQACTVLLAGIEQLPSQATLPFALDSLRILSPCEPNMTAWVRFAAAGTGKGFAKFDIDLINPDGRVCVHIRGYATRVLSNDLNSGLGTYFATPVWQKDAGADSAPTADVVTSHVLLLGMESINSATLGNALGNNLVQHVTVSQNDLISRYHTAALACFDAVKTLIKSKPKSTVLLQVVTTTAASNSLFSGLYGMLATASIENPKIRTQLIFVDEGLNETQLANRIGAERAHLDDEQICYLGNKRRVKRWERQTQIPETPSNVFKDDGVYLITGGMGGLGQHFTRSIIEQTSKATVVLTGRTELDANKQAVLEGFSATGHTVEYRQVDLSDAASVNKVIGDIVSSHKKISGILHAAGMIADSFILKKTHDEIQRVFEPKVNGTVYLDTATEKLDLDFFVLFSSESSLGSLGQADYAAANGFMDQFAGYRNALVAEGKRIGKTLSIDWPLWKDGGMTVDDETEAELAASTGMHPMPTETGLRAFHQLLALDVHQMLLIDGNIARIAQRLTTTRPEAVETHDRINPAPVAAAPVVEKVAPAPATSAPALNADSNKELRSKTTELLKKLFANAFKMSASQLNPTESLENYGIDSILVINITNDLEKTFGSLSKTLLFEYTTIAELVDFFIENSTDKLTEMFGISAVSAPAVPAASAPAAPTTTTAVPATTQKAPLSIASRFGKSSAPAATGGHAAAREMDDIAIIGLSGRYPESRDLEAFWANLRNGVDCITEVPAERWDWREHYSTDTSKEGHHYAKWGGFIPGLDEFDPMFFNMPPRIAGSIDPQERLFLQHAWMALEDSGYTREGIHKPHENNLPAQVGVYVGVMYGDYPLFGAQSSLLGDRKALTSSLANIANRTSHVLNVHGPSFVIDTMCSSSITAIHYACQDLKLGKTDLAITGGVNVTLHPNKYLELSAGQFIAVNGRCQSFGEGGAGYIPGEGVGAIILKRLSEAEADGDNIQGVIRSTSLNHGGKASGYTVPNPNAQAMVISQALLEAKVDPRHISYVEAHGTGTKLGDPIEVAGLTKAFYQNANSTAKANEDTGFCLLGSAKSNIGHCEPAAGVAGLTKVLLQMKHKQVVPSLRSSVLNPHIDFDKTPFVVNQTLTPWERPVIDGVEIPRMAGISSFGAGGSNGHILVQEYQPTVAAGALEGDVLIPLSARTEEQLIQKARDLARFLQERHHGAYAHLPALRLQDIAFTLQVGREAMPERASLTASSVVQLIEKLNAFANGETVDELYRGKVKRTLEGVALLSDDEDMLEAIGKWIARGKYSKLAELWVQGLAIDWAKLHTTDSPRRVSLPTYPFARDSYWWTDKEESDRILSMTAPRSKVAPAYALHPLLHRNVSTLDEQRFVTKFSGNEPFMLPVSDEQRILPASAMVEMARAAIEHGSDQKDGALVLHNLAWSSPVNIDVATGLNVGVALFNAGDMGGSDEQLAFEIYAAGEDSAALSEHVFCQGYAAYQTNALSTRYDVAQFLVGMSGVEHNLAHFGVVEVHADTNQRLVSLQQKADQNVAITPATLEGVLNAANTLVDQQQTGAYQLSLPYGIDTVRVFAPLGEQVFAWVRYSATAPTNAQQVKLDVDLINHEGIVCAQLHGLAYQQIIANAPVLTSEAIAAPAISSPTAPATSAATAVKAASHTVDEKPDHTPRAMTLPSIARREEDIKADTTRAKATAEVVVESPLHKPSNIALAVLTALSLNEQSPTTKPVVTLAAASNLVAGMTGTMQNINALSVTSTASGIYQITLRESALTPNLVDQLIATLTFLAQQAPMNVLVIQSEADSFLTANAEQSADAAANKLFAAIAAIPCPSIAVVKGNAQGAGFLFAALCDFMMVADTALCGFVDVDSGLFAGPSIHALLDERFGSVRAQQLLQISTVQTGAQLHANGWTFPVVAAGELAAAASKFAKSLTGKPPLALRLLKQHLARHITALVDDLADAEFSAAKTQTSKPATLKAVSQRVKVAADSKTINITLSGTSSAAQCADLISTLAAIADCKDTRPVVIASQNKAFIDTRRIKDSAQQVRDIQDAMLSLTQPMVVALTAESSGAALLLAHTADAFVYQTDGVYSSADLANDGDVTDMETAKRAVATFSYRVGEMAAKAILFNINSFSPATLSAYVPTAIIADDTRAKAQEIAANLGQLADSVWQQVKLATQAAINAHVAALDDVVVPAELAIEAVNEATPLSLKSECVTATHYPNDVLLLELHDREAKNMFSTELVTGIDEVFDHVNATPGYKAVIVTGYDNYFAAGGTRAGLMSILEGKAKFTDIETYHAALGCKVPVIAAMQGHGIGAGWSFGMFSDFIMFSEQSKYLSPYMGFGFTPGAGSTLIQRRKLGYDLARETLMNATEIGGRTIKARGLAMPVIARKAMRDAAFELAEQIVKTPRSLLETYKSLFTQLVFEPLRDTYARELAMHDETFVGKAETLELIQDNFNDAKSTAGEVLGNAQALATAQVTTQAASPAPVAHATAPVIRAAQSVASPAEKSAQTPENSHEIHQRLKTFLAQELLMDESDVESDIPFIDLGLDSITGVTWVRKINETYNLEVEATQVYSYPTLGEFANYVAELIAGATALAPASVSEPAASAEPAATNKLANTYASAAPAVQQVAAPATVAKVESAPASDDVLAKLRTFLAQELLMDESDVESDIPFIDLGLDSITGVTWVRKINEEYALDIEATQVYSYPTLQAFSDFVQSALATSATAAPVVSGSVETAPESKMQNTYAAAAPAVQAMPVAPAATITTPVSTPAPTIESAPAPVAAATAASTVALSDVLAKLRTFLSQELLMDESDVEADVPFIDLGLDSITGVTWVRKINEEYALEIEATQVYSYPTLQEFAEFVQSQLGSTATNTASTQPAPVQTAPAQTAPVQTATAQSATAQSATAQSATAKRVPTATLSPAPENKMANTYAAAAPAVQAAPSISSEVLAKPAVTLTAPSTTAELPALNTTPDSSQAPAASAESTATILAELTAFLAQELLMDESDIEADVPFIDLGLDSITGVTWVRKINEKYAQEIEATQVYSYPTLQEFTSFVASLIGATDSAASATIKAAPISTQTLAKPSVALEATTASSPLAEAALTLPAAPAPTIETPKTVTASAAPQATQATWRTLTSWRKPLAERRPEAAVQRALTKPIAIIGMAGQFPGANNVEVFWENIAKGDCAIQEVPEERWSIAEYYQEGEPAQGKTNGKWVGCIEKYDCFDPLFFSISPVEAEIMDPQQRILLQACWHTIENAAYNPRKLSGSNTGIYIGAAPADYVNLSIEQHTTSQGFTGNSISILAARTAYFLNLQGPCITMDTACSSSLTAIATACDNLNAGAIDLALTGGVYVMTGPYMHLKTAHSGMLSQDGRCFTFDQRANGFVPGEGVGVIMLKRLADAQRDNDIIQGVIEGWGINQDGKTNGITAPNAQMQTKLEQMVYDRAGINPEHIQLVEAHGTGTKLGDPIEISALKATFKKYTQRVGYCAVGSVKSNIGHCLAAAGVAGVIKVVMGLKHKQLPPTINYEQTNEHISLSGSPFYINDTLRNWDVEEGVSRRGTVSSFGFSGTNVHLVIAEAPAVLAPQEEVVPVTEQGAVLLPITAKSAEQLTEQAKVLSQYFTRHPQLDILEMAYTLQTCRELMEERLCIVASSPADAAEKLNAHIAGNTVKGVFQGDTYNAKESLKLVAQYDDVRDTLIQKWLETGELSNIADLWVKGLAVEWERFYGTQKPRRIELPGYAFAEEQYWLENAKPLGLEDLHADTKQAGLHPLVHRNLSNFQAQLYEATFSGNEFFLRDHQVNIAAKAGDTMRVQKVFPGVAYLEMARAAIENALPLTEEGYQLELHNVGWIVPVVANEPVTVGIELHLDEGTALTDGMVEVVDYEVFSEQGDQDVIHGQGRAIYRQAAPVSSIDILALQHQCNGEQIQASALYEAFVKTGLNYGPAHQGLEYIQLGDQQLIAKLKLPASVAKNQGEFVLHPSLMDSALQATIGLISRLDSLPKHASVPFSLERINIITACTSDMFAHVRFAAGSDAQQRLMKFDIDLCDEAGNVCVQIRSFSMRVGESSAASADGASFNDAHYTEILEQISDNKLSVEDAVDLG